MSFWSITGCSLFFFSYSRIIFTIVWKCAMYQFYMYLWFYLYYEMELFLDFEQNL